MLFSIAVTLLFLSFFASVVLTGYLRNIARANKLLIDIPDKSRKFHFRPTPLIGGLSIHASMLLSSLFMLFLIDYKYDFQFDGLSLSKPSQMESSSEVGYSKKLSIKKENDDKAEFEYNESLSLIFSFNRYMNFVALVTYELSSEMVTLCF